MCISQLIKQLFHTNYISFKFQKFGCIFECNNNISKIEPKPVVSRPGGLSIVDQHINCGIST